MHRLRAQTGHPVNGHARSLSPIRSPKGLNCTMNTSSARFPDLLHQDFLSLILSLSASRFGGPSICDELPPTVGTGSRADAFEIHEDDWRQVEAIAGSLGDMVQSELRAIRAVYEEHARRAGYGGLIGFDAIHVRSQPARPLPDPPSLRRVLSMLPRPSRHYSGVAFKGADGIAVGSFAVASAGVNVYGLADGDAIEVLCLDGRAIPDAGPASDIIPGLREVMRAFDLVIVDWCRCSVIGPDSVAAYLSR